MSLIIKEVDTVTRKVELRYPKNRPVLEGFVTCEFRPKSQDEIDDMQDQVAAGELSNDEYFRELVPTMEGLPLEAGKASDADAQHAWLRTHKWGQAVRSAITQAYFAQLGEVRQGNSGRSRKR